MASNHTITEEFEISGNDSEATFGSFISAGICDPEIFQKFWENVKHYAPESNDHQQAFFAAAGKEVNNMLVLVNKGERSVEEEIALLPDLLPDMARRILMEQEEQPRPGQRQILHMPNYNRR